jgi:hypothetical protein
MKTVQLFVGRSIQRKAKKLATIWTMEFVMDGWGTVPDVDEYHFSSYTVYYWDNPISERFPYMIELYHDRHEDFSYHFCTNDVVQESDIFVL